MRKKYDAPEFELLKIQINDQLLGASTSSFTPEDPIEEDPYDFDEG